MSNLIFATFNLEWKISLRLKSDKDFAHQRKTVFSLNYESNAPILNKIDF